jgi:hypothetical protein
MIDCPKYADDIGKGIIPGFIHKDCCEDSFANDPSSCVECCDNENLARNISEHFDKLVDVEDLIEAERNGAKVFMSADNVFLISPEIDKFLEPLKPLNVVTETFKDNEKGVIYTRDNAKNTNLYSVEIFENVKKRLKELRLVSRPEDFCVKDGPFFWVYRIANFSIGVAIAPRISEKSVDELGLTVAQTYKEKYLKAEDFFGVQLQPHKEELKKIIQELSEAEFISVVLCPLLTSLGFKAVKAISFHGPGESGGDFHPFYKENEFGKIVYYSAQAKAVKIHSKAGKDGNINEVTDQLKKMFRTPFKSFIDNTEKRISAAFVFSSFDIIAESRDQLFHEIEGNQTINFVDIDDIVKLIVEKNLFEEIVKYSAMKAKKNEAKRTG